MASTIISAAVPDQDGGHNDPPMMTGSAPVGAVVAAAIAVVPAIAGFAIAHTWFFALGIPSAAISGWLIGPAIRSEGGIFGPTMGMALLPIAIADAFFLLRPDMTTATGADAIAPLLVASILGLIIIGFPMVIVTIPCAVAWALVVRKLARRGFGRPDATPRNAA
jgi:hypothetical protein